MVSKYKIDAKEISANNNDTKLNETLLQNDNVEDQKGENREEDVENGVEPENINVEIQSGGP